jgi:hypothetical protein
LRNEDEEEQEMRKFDRYRKENSKINTIKYKPCWAPTF